MKHHILPNHKTKTRATFLSQHFLAFYAMALFVLINALNITPKIAPGILSYASNISFNDLFAETNKIRSQQGLKPLKTNDKLSSAAYKKAQHMFKNNYWAHVAPDGTEPWYFILNEQYDYVFAGENLAKNFNNSRDVVEAWYKSPSHRENLLNPNYDEIGYAVVNGVLDGYQTTLVVQMFGKSKGPDYAASAESVQGSDSNLAQVPENTQQNLELTPQTPNSPNAETPPNLTGDNLQKQTSPIAPKQYAQPNVPQQSAYQEEIVVHKPLITIDDVTAFNQTVSLAFGGFLVSLLSLDVWYSRRKTILKPTGHTLAHIMFLTVLVLSILVLIKPGVIL